MRCAEIIVVAQRQLNACQCVNGTNLQEIDVSINTQRAQLVTLLQQRNLL
jgi:hypothetical protein